jgi:hypothetical protein
MTETIIVAAISLVGTLAGSLGGILAASKLTTYRIEQLEKKVQAHNNLIDRMYKVEMREEVLEEEIEHLKKYHE